MSVFIKLEVLYFRYSKFSFPKPTNKITTLIYFINVFNIIVHTEYYISYTSISSFLYMLLSLPRNSSIDL